MERLRCWEEIGSESRDNLGRWILNSINWETLSSWQPGNFSMQRLSRAKTRTPLRSTFCIRTYPHTTKHSQLFQAQTQCLSPFRKSCGDSSQLRRQIRSDRCACKYHSGHLEQLDPLVITGLEYIFFLGATLVLCGLLFSYEKPIFLMYIGAFWLLLYYSLLCFVTQICSFSFIKSTGAAHMIWYHG